MALGAEFRNHKMIPFVLPLVLLIADDCSIEEYSTLVLPILIPAFRIHDPIQVTGERKERGRERCVCVIQYSFILLLVT